MKDETGGTRKTSPGGPADGRATKSRFLVGLIGEGIQESLSPALHEEEARRQGLTLHYQLIDLAQGGRSVGDLSRLLESGEAAGFDGLNITHPCKQAVLPLLTDLSDDARAIGIVGSYVGNLQELREVVELAKSGKLKPTPVETRPVAEANRTLDELKAGKILGRVVLDVNEAA